MRWLCSLVRSFFLAGAQCLIASFPIFKETVLYMYKFPELFTGHDPTRGSGQGDFKISRVGSGRVG